MIWEKVLHVIVDERVILLNKRPIVTFQFAPCMLEHQNELTPFTNKYAHAKYCGFTCILDT